MMQIRYWNRAKKCEETEQVYGETFVRLLYGNTLGKFFADRVLAGYWLSRLYGVLQSSSLSRRKIASFVEHFKIPMELYEDTRFKTFNEFFIRRFRPGVRPFISDPKRLGAFAEARYLGWDKISLEQTYPVKGQYLTARTLLERADLAQEFEGGPLLIARLCPVDYHRFHYPTDGRTLEQYRLPGKLHSVNPMALHAHGAVLCTNERVVSILDTKEFGKLAYIEVGAMCVGRIMQTHESNQPFTRGDEKGYFLFGASTVILLGQTGRWRVDSDILANTAQGRETYLELGVGVATS
ncbi:phosphatidylserine decarboxylase [Bdellovibrionota bacterium FG-1]